MGRRETTESEPAVDIYVAEWRRNGSESGQPTEALRHDRVGAAAESGRPPCPAT